MQEVSKRRTNEERTRQTRAALMAAARALFVSKGYADTSTPEIVRAASVTRGALYHHFTDKKALFHAIAEAEAEAVAAEIETASAGALAAIEALVAGGKAFLAAMAREGRARLLLVEAPAALGPEAVREIDARHAKRTLREGLSHAMATGAIRSLPLDALTESLSAVFDRAALAVAEGEPESDWHAVIATLVAGLAEEKP